MQKKVMALCLRVQFFLANPVYSIPQIMVKALLRPSLNLGNQKNFWLKVEFIEDYKHWYSQLQLKR